MSNSLNIRDILYNNVYHKLAFIGFNVKDRTYSMPVIDIFYTSGTHLARISFIQDKIRIHKSTGNKYLSYSDPGIVGDVISYICTIDLKHDT